MSSIYVEMGTAKLRLGLNCPRGLIDPQAAQARGRRLRTGIVDADASNESAQGKLDDSLSQIHRKAFEIGERTISQSAPVGGT